MAGRFLQKNGGTGIAPVRFKQLRLAEQKQMQARGYARLAVFNFSRPLAKFIF
jgi:hypothetical protein